jgi:hypothetical protein
MTSVVYEVVEHDGGWAYRVGPVFSEVYPSHDQARRAAEAAAQRQQREGETTDIEYEDARGKWHTEHARGGDRPETVVEDAQSGDKAAPANERDAGPINLSQDVGAEEPLPDGPRVGRRSA